MKLVINLFLALFCCSCASMNRTITVVYLIGTFDSSVSINCDTLKKRYAGAEADTVIDITNNEFDAIIELLKIPHTTETGCDTRMYIQYDSLALCYRDFDRVCGIDSEEITDKQKWGGYQIKCKSGYYNHIHREDLEYYEYIEKFGIPQEYKYFNNGLDEKSRFVKYLNMKHYVKVLLKVKKH